MTNQQGEGIEITFVWAFVWTGRSFTVDKDYEVEDGGMEEKTQIKNKVGRTGIERYKGIGERENGG